MKRILFILSILSASATAQTRFYFSSTGIPSISPAFGFINGSAWTSTTNAIRRNMATTKDGSAMTTTASSGGVTLSNSALNVQFISPALAAQTINNTGTFKIQMRGLTNTASRSVVALSLKVVDATGTTVRGWLIEGFTSGSQYSTTLVNKGTAGTGQTISTWQSTAGNVTVQAGDYLVLEVGQYRNSGSGTITSQQSIGSDNATDLPGDNTTTTANNPWFELSQTINFSAPPPSTNTGIPISILMN